MKSNAPLQFAFFLVPSFSMLALSGAVDVLRAANAEVEYEAFSWKMVGAKSSVTSSSGIPIECKYHYRVDSVDAIAICGGDASHNYDDPHALQWFRDQARMGVIMGSISDGAFVAARAGLFANTPSTIHWKCIAAYREMFSELDVRPSMLEFHSDRFSCAGGTSSLDLLLKFVSERLGPEVAGRVAANYFHDSIRGEEREQMPIETYRISMLDRRLSQAMSIMQDNLEEPLEIGQLCQQISISHRQLDRLFRRHLGVAPSAYYRRIRLGHAAALLQQSDLSISEISAACGFQSASHLARHFRTAYQKTPSQYRMSTHLLGW